MMYNVWCMGAKQGGNLGLGYFVSYHVFKRLNFTASTISLKRHEKKKHLEYGNV